jgi:hypothetical protein
LTTWTLKGHFFHFYPFWVILKAIGSPFNLHFIFKPSLKKKVDYKADDWSNKC